MDSQELQLPSLAFLLILPASFRPPLSILPLVPPKIFSMRILVTGGTGLLGNTILRQLAANSSGGGSSQNRRPSSGPYQLVALVRGQPDPEVFDGLSVEFVRADLGSGNPQDREAVFAVIESCDAVIHSAGFIHLGWEQLDQSMAVNRDGTRLLVDACCKFNVPLVHVGTINTLAVGSREKPGNEDSPLVDGGGQINSSYVLSKRAGVDEVVAATTSRKLRSVIVHPGFMLGPWDWKPSSGRMIVIMSKRWQPLAPSGGNSICDSRDVAAATITAMQHLIPGTIEPGRQYILAGENWTFFELWKAIARRTGRRGPIMPAGPAQRWIGRMTAEVISKLRKEEGDINTAALLMSCQFHWYDSSRARQELGYRSRDPLESLDDAIKWLRERGEIT